MIDQFKKLFLAYFFATGVIGQVLLLSAIIFIPLYFQEPISFFWERSLNHFSHSKIDRLQKISTWLIQKNLVNNWSDSTSQPILLMPSLASWKGQGAAYQANIKTVLSENNPHYHMVQSSQELIAAIHKANPGDIIHLFPGTYQFHGQSIAITRPGTDKHPITVQSSRLGLVQLLFDLQEGFHILAPYWHFENLQIKGNCKNDSRCEHAFHVVGKASHFVLRNSIISDFNAPLKVNGLPMGNKTYYPDTGLIEKNIIFNTRKRQTANPVTLLNIDSVNNWRVNGNLIADFSKGQGDHISYGAFMKGNGRNGIFENNLVLCEMKLPADQGIRIGLSFGGGGTGKAYCRNQDCTTEFTQGVIRNNIIAHCSHDVGIYLNRAAKTKIYNNLIFNTLGIDVRFATSSAEIFNNLISGRIKQRDNGQSSESHNIIDKACLSPARQFSNCAFNDWFWDINNLDLTLIAPSAPFIGKGIAYSGLTQDFCGHPINPYQIDLGPIQYSNHQQCSPIHMH